MTFWLFTLPLTFGLGYYFHEIVAPVGIGWGALFAGLAWFGVAFAVNHGAEPENVKYDQNHYQDGSTGQTLTNTIKTDGWQTSIPFILIGWLILLLSLQFGFETLAESWILGFLEHTGIAILCSILAARFGLALGTNAQGRASRAQNTAEKIVELLDEAEKDILPLIVEGLLLAALWDKKVKADSVALASMTADFAKQLSWTADATDVKRLVKRVLKKNSKDIRTACKTMCTALQDFDSGSSWNSNPDIRRVCNLRDKAEKLLKELEKDDYEIYSHVKKAVEPRVVRFSQIKRVAGLAAGSLKGY